MTVQRLLFAFLIWISVCAPTWAAIAIGATATQNIASGNTSNTQTITDATTNIWVCVAVSTERTNAQGSLSTVVSVTDVVGVTFTKRASTSQSNFGTNGYYINLEEWCGFSSGALAAAVITVTVSAAVDDGTFLIWTIDGANTSTLFDTDGSLPVLASHVGTTAPTATGVSTSCASDMVVLLTNSATYGTSETAGTGYTIITQQANGGGVIGLNTAAEQQIFATNQSGISPAFGTNWQDWLVIADAYQQAGATCSGAAAFVGYKTLLGVGK